MEQTVIFQATDGWRWHTIDLGNGRKIATSGEAFSSKFAAKRAAEGAKASLARAPIVIREPLPSPPSRFSFGSVPMPQGTLADALKGPVRSTPPPANLAAMLARIGSLKP